MRKALKNIGLGALAFVLLMAIGLITRPIAIALGINYGMHAVLAALFYGLFVACYETGGTSAWCIGAGGIVYGAIMGMMSPVMAVAALVPAVAYLVVSLIMRAAQAEAQTRAVTCGTLFAACAYAAVIAGGAAFSGYAPGVADIAFLVVSAGLGLLGSLLGIWLVEKVIPEREGV